MLARRPLLLAGLLGLGATAGLQACSALSGRPHAQRVADGADSAGLPLTEAGVAGRVLKRISFGSCADDGQPQPVWAAVLADAPDLHLFGGDNVYASSEPWQLQELRESNARLAAVLGFVQMRQRIPHLAIWDDNDYGLNDGGVGFAHKAESREEFLRFWQVAATDERRTRGGIYHARRFGPLGQRVQVIMLDVRWFRSAWQPTDQRGAPGKERYLPSNNPAQDMLGAEQWAWLAEQLRQPADVRLVVSGIQVIAEGHGWEHWGLFPREQQRLLDLIAQTRAEGVLLLSGDRHIGAVYRRSRGAPYALTEVTSSGLTHSYAKASETGPNRLGELVRQNHYVTIDIDWAERKLQLTHKDVGGRPLQQHLVVFDTLRPS